jgi:glycogen operon protein
VSYEQKHNEANGENNQDGDNHNLSWNCGVEGPTDDPAIRVLRERQRRNLIATLFLSQGVPMISGGDELGRTQRGNNNAYCQDNDVSWTDWTPTSERRAFLDFVRRANRLMRDHAVLRRRRFFEGRGFREADIKDIMWLAPTGREMANEDWGAEHLRCVGMRLSGDAIGDLDDGGAAIRGETLLCLLNAAPTLVPFTLPSFVAQPRWETILETFDESREGQVFAGGHVYQLTERSLVVFRLRMPGARAGA